MKFYVLASSSAGNASYIETKNRKILIDAGISYTRIKNKLKDIGVNYKDLTDLFITHEHKDHIAGLEVLLKHVNLTVHTSKGTYEGIKQSFLYNAISAYETVKLDDLNVKALPLSHDANEPLGFLFENSTKSLVYLTDTGYIYQDVLDEIKNKTLYFLESNHDPHLLINSPRPFYLINRILNEKGHLSNYDAAYYLSKAIGENTTHVVFAHISQECNNINLINQTFNDVLETNEKNFENIKFVESLKDESLPVIKL